MYGNQVPKYQGAARDVIGFIDHSGAGNVVLGVGHELEKGWSKTAHIVLNRDEAASLIVDLATELRA